ncbi:hypothetical protein RDI58_007266 [Solanum bulbocastanum]|uniref:Uncharacterized protein n=1 Tax=Solanum bulbocastanum TaxID=147425 RepID=A0AAN8YLZ2_SOLBU
MFILLQCYYVFKYYYVFWTALSEEPVATFSTSPPFTTTPPFNIATADGATVDVVGDDDIYVGPAGPDFSEEEVMGSDYSTEDSVESEA